MDKQELIDKMVEARKLTDEALAGAYGMDDGDLIYRAENALDAIDFFLVFLEKESD